MVGGVVAVVKDEGDLISMLFVALPFPFGSSSCSWGGSCAGFVGALSFWTICVSSLESSFVATAVGGIVGGVRGGELFVMMHLIARRSVSRPARYSGWGSVEITGGLGQLLGGVPIATVSLSFR